MLFLSRNEALKTTMMEDFLSERPGKTLVLFRDEKEIPVVREGINLYAPGCECSFGFDPAFDMLSASSSVREAAYRFSEALVTDGDILKSKDPIWPSNARNLLSSLFTGGVCLWKFMHEQHGGGPVPPDFPGLTDVVFGMLDDIAAARMRSGDPVSRTRKTFPEWWNIIPDDEQSTLSSIMLDAPLNTAGSLVAVTTAFTGGIQWYYSGEKCAHLFDTDQGYDAYAYLPALNAPTVNLLLRTARAAWGRELRIVAREMSSWSAPLQEILANFLTETFSFGDGCLLLDSNPPRGAESWHTGDIAWGNALTSRASAFFRRTVEESTGNPNGRITSLALETPESCGEGEWLLYSGGGWSQRKLSEARTEEMKRGRGHIKIRPAEDRRSEEMQAFLEVFEGRKPSSLSYEKDGRVFINCSASWGEAEPADESDWRTPENPLSGSGGSPDPDPAEPEEDGPEKEGEAPF